MPLKQAMVLVKRRRPQAEPIPAFCKMLESYEDTCRSLGLIKSEDTSDKRKSEAPLSSQDVTAKRKRTIGPSIGPSLPKKQTKDKKVKRQAIGPASGPLRKENSKESIGPHRTAIGPSSEQKQHKESPKLKAGGDSERKDSVHASKAAKD